MVVEPLVITFVAGSQPTLERLQLADLGGRRGERGPASNVTFEHLAHLVNLDEVV